MTVPDRSAIATEAEHPRAAALHQLDAGGWVALMNEANREVLAAMDAAAPALSGVIAAAAPGFVRGGRLVYIGAGTSGRLGVLDASEAPPTFCVGDDRIIGIIAGGDRCLRAPSEGAEDDAAGAIPALRPLALGADDCLLGIAAGGTTPYVRGALAWAAALRPAPLTALLTCADVPAPAGCAHRLLLPTGPEVLTGSTRLKAGTATKLALNTISTALMALSGRVYDRYMVDVRAGNAKLVDRAARIIAALTGLARPAALDLLERAGGSAKVAVAMHRLGGDRTQAETRLAAAGGRLDRLDQRPG